MFPNIMIYSNLCLSLQSDALSPHCHSRCHVAESFRWGVYTPGTRQEELQEVTRPNKWIFKFKSEFRCVVRLATWCYCPNFGWDLCELHHCCSFLPSPSVEAVKGLMSQRISSAGGFLRLLPHVGHKSRQSCLLLEVRIGARNLG